MADQDDPPTIRTFSFPEDFEVLDYIYQQTAHVACDKMEIDLITDLMTHLDFSTFAVMSIVSERAGVPFEEALAQHCENVRNHYRDKMGKDSNTPKPH